MGHEGFGLGRRHREFAQGVLVMMADFIRTEETDFIDVVEGTSE